MKYTIKVTRISANGGPLTTMVTLEGDLQIADAILKKLQEMANGRMWDLE